MNLTHFSCELDMGHPAKARDALALFERLKHDDRLRQVPLVHGFEVALAGEPPNSLLWIHNDEDGNPDAVVDFVLRLASDFGLVGLWGFQYARLGSQRFDGAFGGGAHILDLGNRAILRQTCTQDWLDIGLAAPWLC